jgi:uncharacterized protein GlcG (DUF336 family)
MAALDLDTALRIAAATRAHARENSLNPLTIVVLEAGGQIKTVLREDGAGLRGVEIALAKARGALAFGTSSREVGAMFRDRPDVLNALCITLGGELLPIPGAVLLTTANGEIRGAVAAAGDLPDRDEAAAQQGAAQVDLNSPRA